jgi:hypothetical protein
MIPFVVLLSSKQNHVSGMYSINHVSGTYSIFTYRRKSSKLSLIKLRDSQKTKKLDSEVKVMEMTSVAEDDSGTCISETDSIDSLETQSSFSDTSETPLSPISRTSAGSEFILVQNKRRSGEFSGNKSRSLSYENKRKSVEISDGSSSGKRLSLGNRPSMSLGNFEHGVSKASMTSEYPMSSRSMYLSNFQTRIERLKFCFTFN